MNSKSLFHVTCFFFNIALIMFHLHSLKELPPKECVKQLTPPVKWKLQYPVKNHSLLQSNDKLNSRQLKQPSCRDQYNGTISKLRISPFQKIKHGGNRNRAFLSKYFSEFSWLYYNEESDSVLCFICMQQNAKSNLS